VTKWNANDLAHLVRQGQKEVIEEDGCSCNWVVLDVMSRSQLQKRLKSTPTLPAVLRVLVSRGRVSATVDGIRGRGRTSDSRCR